VTQPVWVTGAGGFCGRVLAQSLLSAGEEVIGWVRSAPVDPVPGVRYRYGDLCDTDRVRQALVLDRPRALFHLAAMADPRACEADPIGARRVNVEMVEQLVSALAAISPETSLLFASTCHVYGPPRCLPIDESHPLSPRGVYAQTKADGEAAALRGLQAGLRVVVSRAFHQSGPGHGESYALGSWAAQIARGATEVRVGDLSVRRDYTDVRDVARGLAVLMARGPNGAVVNLCSAVAPPLRVLLESLIGPRAVQIVVDTDRLRPTDVPELRGDASRALVLGWAPQISREQMLSDLLAHYSSRTSI
jgi:GDP-4-dehydro-6-deoxy-D-mannose reductase